MKLTSAEANKMIRALKDQFRLLLLQEENVVSFSNRASRWQWRLTESIRARRREANEYRNKYL